MYQSNTILPPLKSLPCAKSYPDKRGQQSYEWFGYCEFYLLETSKAMWRWLTPFDSAPSWWICSAFLTVTHYIYMNRMVACWNLSRCLVDIDLSANYHEICDFITYHTAWMTLWVLHMYYSMLLTLLGCYEVKLYSATTFDVEIFCWI